MFRSKRTTLATFVVVGVGLIAAGLRFGVGSKQLGNSGSNAVDELAFEADVLPILKSRCVPCHGPGLAESGLRLDSLEHVLAGSKMQSIVVPGKPYDSELIHQIRGESPSMPPEGEPLTPLETGTLVRWIYSVKTTETAQSRVLNDDQSHWAWEPPKPIKPPRLEPTDRSEIDPFVRQTIQVSGLEPNPEADRETLARRLTIDLVGLLPTIEEVDAFLADKEPGAVERLVDRLLASPAFGEHWGRYWLDLARYADTNGYHRDVGRPISLYRDWVISAFNSNQPFDEFTLEQLAGDLLDRPTDEQLIATGFHRNTMFNQEGGVDAEEFRVKAVMDRVETTATVWLGMTFRCARCHNHPYDPISQRDYYQLFAFFNDTIDTGGGRSNRPEPVIELADPQQRRELDDIRQKIEACNDWLGQHDAEQDQYDEKYSELTQLMAQQRRLWKEVPTSLIMQQTESARETYVLGGGDFLQPTEKVAPGIPALFRSAGGSLRGELTSRRDLAEWLVSDQNPLVARAAVNRVWEKLFGRGLVTTPSDFGLRGAAPDHPELLDFLAWEFRDSGWDFKQLLRTIVTSRTYRQSSTTTTKHRKLDPTNRLLARGPRFRMEAEMIRDCSLFAAGLLQQRVGGLSVYPPQPAGLWESVAINRRNTEHWVESSGEDRFRRGLYTYWRRSVPYPSFATLDAPSREYCKVTRSRTNTPLQALVTLNDPAFVEAAEGLANRMLTSRETNKRRIEFGFRLCITRRPKPTEVQALERLLNQLSAEELSEQQRWTVVANVLLNLDSMLTKW